MLSNFANTVANIKVGLSQKRSIVRCTSSAFTERVLQKFMEAGYIRGFGFDSKKKKLLIRLKYDLNFTSVIRDLKIISTSGHRVYFSYKQVLEAQIRGEHYILSTNKGLYTIHEIVLSRLNIGGEVIVQIFLY